MLILPGNLAFFLILSLVPIISLTSIAASILSISLEGVFDFLSSIMPSEVMNFLISSSNIKISNILVTIIGFFIASNGADSLIVASNILYKTENKSYIYRRVKAIFMTVWLLLLFIFTLLFLAFGSFILTKILSFGVIGEFISEHYIIITMIKYLIAFS